MSAAGSQAASRLGEALNPGVTRRELWAWAMYDFANSGYTTVVLTTVFSAYFVGVVAAGRDWGTLAFTSALSVSYLLVMLTMPALGARADAKARRRRFLFLSTAGCVAATAMLALAGPNDIAIGLLALAISNYCYCVANLSSLPSCRKSRGGTRWVVCQAGAGASAISGACSRLVSH